MKDISVQLMRIIENIPVGNYLYNEKHWRQKKEINKKHSIFNMPRYNEKQNNLWLKSAKTTNRKKKIPLELPKQA